jgi:hypothetical protein
MKLRVNKSLQFLLTYASPQTAGRKSKRYRSPGNDLPLEFLIIDFYQLVVSQQEFDGYGFRGRQLAGAAFLRRRALASQRLPSGFCMTDY